MQSPVTPHDSAVADVPLLTAARRGDHAAFAAIVRRHEGLVHGYMRARLPTPRDLDDLCQEVFIRLYTGRDLPAEASLGSWILGIARNVLREHVRAARRRREQAWTELCLEVEDRAAAPAAGGRFDEALSRLPACLEALGPSARRAIDLYYADSLPMRELAEHFKRSEGAVKLLVHRARQAVRRCLDATLSGEGA